MTALTILSAAAFCVPLPHSSIQEWPSTATHVVQHITYATLDGKSIPIPKKSHLAALGNNSVDIDDLILALEADNGQDFLSDERRWVGEIALGDRDDLASLRLKAGLSQKQLAERMGMKQPQLARIERGRHDVKVSMIRRLAEALDVSESTVYEAVKQSTVSEGGLA